MMPPMTTTTTTRTRRSTPSTSTSSSLPPAATEFLSAAFGQASPGLQPSLVVNAAVFTLGAKVLSAGLTPPAVAASFLLGTLSFAAFGWRGYLIVCGYFVAGSAVTKLRLAQKQAEGIAEARGGRRAPGSVVGSGLAGALAAAAALVIRARPSTSTSALAAAAAQNVNGSNNDVALALCATAFVASFASKLADTASSEVGKAFGTKAYLSTTLERVPRGTEGAVSAEGSLAGLAAPGTTLVRRIHQVHHRHVAQVEPVAPERKIRPRAFNQADQLDIEITGALELGTPDGDVLQRENGHGMKPA